MIGEGTNEIQRLVIARRLLERYAVDDATGWSSITGDRATGGELTRRQTNAATAASTATLRIQPARWNRKPRAQNATPRATTATTATTAIMTIRLKMLCLWGASPSGSPYGPWAGSTPRAEFVVMHDSSFTRDATGRRPDREASSPRERFRLHRRADWPSGLSAADPARLHQPVVVGQDHGLDAVPDAELGQDVVDVGLDRRLADVEPLGDLGVAGAADHLAQHVHLPIGQLGEPVGDVSRRRLLGAAGELIEQPFGHLRLHQGVAGVGGPDGRDQLLGRRRLEQEPAGPGPHGREEVLVEVEGGQHHHLGVALLDQAAARLHPVEPGHPHVHEHHVGPEPAGLLDGFEPVGRLPDHLEVVLGFEDQAQAPAHHRFVVGQEQAYHSTSLAAGGPLRRYAADRGGRPVHAGAGR